MEGSVEGRVYDVVSAPKSTLGSRSDTTRNLRRSSILEVCNIQRVVLVSGYLNFVKPFFVFSLYTKALGDSISTVTGTSPLTNSSYRIRRSFATVSSRSTESTLASCMIAVGLLRSSSAVTVTLTRLWRSKKKCMMSHIGSHSAAYIIVHLATIYGKEPFSFTDHKHHR